MPDSIKNLRLYCRHWRFLRTWPEREETEATTIRKLIDEKIAQTKTAPAFQALLEGNLDPADPRGSLRVTPEIALAAFNAMSGESEQEEAQS